MAERQSRALEDALEPLPLGGSADEFTQPERVGGHGSC